MAATNPQDEVSKGFEEDARIYDYVKACNPVLPEIPVLAHDPTLHQTGKPRLQNMPLPLSIPLPAIINESCEVRLLFSLTWACN